MWIFKHHYVCFVEHKFVLVEDGGEVLAGVEAGFPGPVMLDTGCPVAVKRSLAVPPLRCVCPGLIGADPARGD